MHACTSSCGCADGSEHGEEEGGSQRQQPQRWVSVVVLLAFWAVFVAFQLMLSHWPKCSPAYWAIFSLQAGLCLAAEVVAVRVVRARVLRSCNRENPFSLNGILHRRR